MDSRDIWNLYVQLNIEGKQMAPECPNEAELRSTTREKNSALEIGVTFN